MRRHIEAVHENIRNHVCGECGYASNERNKLKIHIARGHEKIRNDDKRMIEGDL